jgi:hypothetical protein
MPVCGIVTRMKSLSAILGNALATEQLFRTLTGRRVIAFAGARPYF